MSLKTNKHFAFLSYISAKKFFNFLNIAYFKPKVLQVFNLNCASLGKTRTSHYNV